MHTPSSSADYEELIQQGYTFDIGDYINKGFNLFRTDILPFIGYTAILAPFLIGVQLASEWMQTEGTTNPERILEYLPLFMLGFVVYGLLIIPFSAGYYIYAEKIARNEERTFADFFAAFKLTGPLLLTMILAGIMMMVGFILLIFPGIYLAIAYTFIMPLVALKGISGWEAMEISRKVVTKNWWWFFLTAVVVGVIGFLGQSLLYIGTLATTPLVYCIQYAMFADIMDQGENSLESKIDKIGSDE